MEPEAADHHPVAVPDEQIIIVNDNPVVTVPQPMDVPPATGQSQPSEEILDLASNIISVPQQ